MNNLKKLWPYLLAVIVFAVVACVYMSPVLQGKVIATSDGIQGTAAVHEAVDYYEQTGQRTWWTGAMFSGMPNYQIGGGRYMADNWMMPIKKVLLAGHGNALLIVLYYCLAFFALLRSMKVGRWLAIVGALAIAFSSYFFIIIGANHHSKTSTLALMSAVVAGFYLIYNGHRRLGVVITMVGAAIGFYPHPQMSYYMCFVIGAFWVAELAKAATQGTWRAFGLSTLIFAASFGIGLGTGTAKTFTNLEYAQETMRGGHSDLVKADDSDNKTGGLDLDYATAWSYGIDECWTFLIPNYMGGSSNYNLGADSDLCQEMVSRGVPRSTAQQFCQSVPTYWGDQPFTAGPVYMGAIVCLLFVLGLLIVDGPYKWALLAVTLLSVCLSWGNHWMDLTRFFFDYVPMYNKFRAVSSILVIAEVTMPLLGFLAVQRLVSAKREGSGMAALGRKVLVSAGVLVVLLFGALATTSGFVSPTDRAMQLPEWLSDAIVAQREAMFTADVWRSMGFVVVAAAVLWGYVRIARLTEGHLAIALGLLVLLDMWPVDKRFMNDGMFSKADSYERAFRMQPWEKMILDAERGGDDPGYRVFNVAQNPFNDARTSYRMKSIGGYSAAKLRRYQDLIDQHLSKFHQPVIDMLNAKYYVVDGGDQMGLIAQRNPDAMGNAWYVGRLMLAETPNAECDGLMEVDLHQTAIVGRDFATYAELSGLPIVTSAADVADGSVDADSDASGTEPSEALASDTPATPTALGTVRMTHYTPAALDYEAQSAEAGTIVFSEIYYPYGWKALVDDQPVDHYRVNYMLRALNVPAGHHHIRFEFKPDSVTRGNVLSMAFVIAMYLIVIGIVVAAVMGWRRRAEGVNDSQPS